MNYVRYVDDIESDELQLAAPKSKYVESILAATRGGESGVADIFRTLQLRLRDSTWTIVFKSLIIVHLMIREGSPDVTLKFLAESPKRMAISQFTEVQTQGVSIRRYYEYLLARVTTFRDSKTDHVRSGAGRLKELTVDKGLLRQTEFVQEQIKALLRCDMLGSHDPDNEISITAFRLLTLDLLELFKVMNEGTINVLESYFEMSRPDAERSLAIYKTFGKQTDQVVQYLSLARQYELYTKLEVPKLKHAPTTLTSSLQDYLNDPDFEVNRRQYLAQQEAKRSGRPLPKSQPGPTPFDKPAAATASFPAASAAPTTTRTQPKGPAPDLIDFFESIEQNQQAMQQPQQNSAYAAMPQHQIQPQQQMPPQATGYNPFMQQQNFAPQLQPQQQQFTAAPQPLQPDFTGAGFGGYGPQPQQQPQFGFPSQLTSIPQDDVADFQYQPPAQALQPQQTSSNPFRQSMLPASQSPIQNSPIKRQSTNPFAKHGSSPLVHDQITNSSSFASSPPPMPTQSQEIPIAQPLQSQATGTNPFAKNRAPAAVANPIAVNITGSTNPFRQSQFVSQATGTGWQHTNQGTFAGFDMNTVNTTPVFPRPGA